MAKNEEAIQKKHANIISIIIIIKDTRGANQHIYRQNERSATSVLPAAGATILLPCDLLIVDATVCTRVAVAVVVGYTRYGQEARSALTAHVVHCARRFKGLFTMLLLVLD